MLYEYYNVLSVCITVKYQKKKSDILSTVTWGGNVVYKKEVSSNHYKKSVKSEYLQLCYT